MSQPRVRGHRYAGVLACRDFTRHTGVETVAIIGAAAAVAGTAVSAYAAYSAGQAQQQASKYNAKVAANQAEAARNAAAVRAQQAALQHRRVAASNVAAAGSSGVEVAAGSPLLVLADEAMQADLEQQRIRYGGELEASTQRANERLFRFQGQQARAAGGLRAGTTLLSGASAFATRYGGRSGGSIDPNAGQAN